MWTSSYCDNVPQWRWIFITTYLGTNPCPTVFAKISRNPSKLLFLLSPWCATETSLPPLEISLFCSGSWVPHSPLFQGLTPYSVLGSTCGCQQALAVGMQMLALSLSSEEKWTEVRGCELFIHRLSIPEGCHIETLHSKNSFPTTTLPGMPIFYFKWKFSLFIQFLEIL